MDNFLIDLEGAEGSYTMQVEPTDNNGLMQYVVSVPEPETGPFSGPWNAVIEPESGGWKQSPESIDRGPVLPCFLVEEIGGEIERRLK